MGYDCELEPDELPFEMPPDLDISLMAEHEPTDLEKFVGEDSGEYVVYRQ